jgi:AcrR family transcriptional regulator
VVSDGVRASRGSARRNVHDFFTAAYGLLGQGGPNSLTVAALCDRLDVSKGSFYHHFGDMDVFVERFANSWSAWGDQLFIYMAAQSHPHRRLEIAANEAFVIMSPGAQAMRAWARTNPTIADALASPEQIWWKTAAEVFAEAAEDDNTGSVLATMGNAIGVGFQLRPKPLERERYIHYLALLYRSYGVETDVLRFGDRTRLEVVTWDRRRFIKVDSGPLPTDDASATTAAIRADPIDLGRTRRAKEDYFRTATGLLGEHGSNGLTIAGLVEKLNLSSGSFQYHFGSMPRFVEQFTAHWERVESQRIQGCMCERDPWRRMELLHAGLLIDPDPADTARRAWGRTNPVVAAAICRVDHLRERALMRTISQLIDSPDSAALAEMTLAFAIGLHRWGPPFGPALRARTAIEWMRRILAIDAAVRTEDGPPRLAFSPA